MNNAACSTTVFIILLHTLSSIEMTVGCYIIDCPLAGKRSEADAETIQGRHQLAKRDCPSCGPGGRGQCVSDTTCCGMSMGCLIGTSESRHCAEENFYRTQCRVGGAACGQFENGRCVAPRICCSDGVCVKDSSCGTSFLPETLSRVD